ncbi:hypothetical protein NDU88_009917 [Pleurodeles waltl]|uniref:Uncharacterized protein n=1 Tax=Pleurodeles waltl TaxID=8319 RepID=A0AAV7PWP9_PLEWA|nr:hypothetical protein NDU88_009917 [Pleurodeles waltl]
MPPWKGSVSSVLQPLSQRGMDLVVRHTIFPQLGKSSGLLLLVTLREHQGVPQDPVPKYGDLLRLQPLPLRMPLRALQGRPEEDQDAKEAPNDSPPERTPEDNSCSLQDEKTRMVLIPLAKIWASNQAQVSPNSRKATPKTPAG